MKKIICFICLLATLAALTVFPVSAANEYDPSIQGRVTVTVKTPQGFDEVVYLTLMDSAGGGKNYPILPQSNYTLVENITCGFYYVSAFVNNDVFMEYVVLRNVDEVTVSEEKDLFIELTVTGGPQDVPDAVIDTDETISEETTPDTAPPAVDAPDASGAAVPDETAPGEVGAETGSDNATTAPAIDSGTADDETDGAEEERERPFWADAAISFVGTAIFVGIVFLLVYLVRKFGNRS